MRPVAQTIALVAEALALAGPILERLGVEDSAVIKQISSGIRTVTDILDRIGEGAEQYHEKLEELVTEFRALKETGGISPEALHKQAYRIAEKTRALRAVVEANRPEG